VNAVETAATIALEVKNGKKAAIAFTLPVNHTVFWGAAREDTLRSGRYCISISAFLCSRATTFGYTLMKIILTSR
jgi:hypothetical protein